jgi:hypothetical protein
MVAMLRNLMGYFLEKILFDNGFRFLIEINPTHDAAGIARIHGFNQKILGKHIEFPNRERHSILDVRDGLVSGDGNVSEFKHDKDRGKLQALKFRTISMT